MKTNFRTEATAKQIIEVLESNSFYHNSRQQNYNSNIDKTNKVVTLFGQSPINRAELWLDATSIVFFFGANIRNMIEQSFEVLTATETATEEQKEQLKSFVETFNSTINQKYRISRDIETKHNFKSFEQFKSFIENSNSLLETAVVELQKYRQQKAEEEQKKAEAETAEAETAEEQKQTEATAEQKQKKQSRQKKQNSRQKKQSEAK